VTALNYLNLSEDFYKEFSPMLKSIIVSCITLLLLTSCTTGKQVAKTSAPNRGASSYFEPAYHPLYFRDYSVDWNQGFSNGFGEVEVNGNWGYINSSGQIAIKPKFNEASPFHEGIGMVRSGAIINRRKAALVRLYGQWKYIDKKGRAIFKMPSNYYVGGKFSEGLARVCVKGKSTGFLTSEQQYGFIDMKGQIVIPAEYDDVFSFSEGLAMIRDHTGTYPKSGYINKAGKVVIAPQYDNASNFSEGLAVVTFAGKKGLIDQQGNVTWLPYDSLEPFSEGLAVVAKSGKHGYIDKSRKLVIPLKFDDAKPFSEGLTAVVVGKKIGYINKSGEYVIKPQFEHFPYWKSPSGSGLAPFVSSFSEGLAAVISQ
jgi:hypothetical protein